MKFVKDVVGCSILLTFLSVGIVGEENPFRVKSVALFKNGSAFVQKELRLDASTGGHLWNEFAFPAKIMFGSLFFSAPGNRIRTLRTHINNIDSSRPFATLSELVSGNIGKKVTIKLKTFPQPLQATIFKIQGETLLLQADRQWIAAPMASIEHIQFTESPTLTETVSQHRMGLRIEFEKKNSSQPLEMMYMQKGMTWMPNYFIEINDETKAQLRLQATVINDCEDLESATLHFVVGVPTFLFSYLESPFTSNQPLDDFLSELNREEPEGDANVLSNAIVSQRISLRVPERGVAVAPDAEGSTDEGLFFYKPEKVTLKRGERANVEIMETPIVFENIYLADLQTNENLYSEYSNYYDSRRKGDKTNHIWHGLRFKNPTSLPWTTGPAFISRKSDDQIMPVSQNRLDYTPAGAPVVLKTTISPDIVVTDTEDEMERVQNAIPHHDLLTIKARIHIQNFKKKPIHLNIHRIIMGELQESSVPWKHSSKLKTWNIVNKKNDTEWELSLEAGESKKIEYTYKIYILR